MQMAVEKATRDDISEMSWALEQLKAEALSRKIDLDRLYEADLEFHAAIERGAHNSLAINVGQLINRLTTPTRRATIVHLLAQGQSQQFISLHQQLLDVVVQRNVDLTRKAIEDHYSFWIKEFETGEEK